VIHLGVLVAVALALGIYLIGTTVLISKDGVFYIDLAQSLPGNLPAVVSRHSLGYPALIWVVHSAARLFAGGDSIQSWVHASQSATLLCRVLALVPLYLLARGLVGSRCAFWAGLILIVLPYPAHYGSDALRDWPYVLFLGLGLWLLYTALQRRAWWMFAPVGLAAAGGYFVQPAAVQLILYGLLGLTVSRADWRNKAVWEPVAAAVLLLAGFIVPVAPHVYASGTLIPRQWNPSRLESPPAIVAVGGKSARSGPLEFGVTICLSRWWAYLWIRGRSISSGWQGRKLAFRPSWNARRTP
jgi:4-amino-4-deoxy-L-arabinose transferase-like glycosyltransferase